MADDKNGHTHEPSLREVTVQLDYLEKLINANDRLYTERYQAQEKAIYKAEDSQKTYNQGHNDLSRKMEAQYTTMVTQVEASVKWEAIDKAIEENRRELVINRTSELSDISNLRIELMKEISSLRESRSSVEGKDKVIYRDSQQKNWNIGMIIIPIIFGIVGVVALVVSLIKH